MATYVIDQNMMQNPALAALIVSEPDARFIIPDVAFVEMSKDEDWEYTMRLAFEQLTPAADRTFHSLAVGEVLSIEMESWHAANALILLPDDFKVFVQSLIVELAENREGASKTTLRAQFQDARADLLANELDHERAKSVIAKFVDQWATGLKPAVLKAMRNGTFDNKFRQCFIKVNAEEFFLKYVKAVGLPEDDSEVFMAGNPMVLRYFYLLTRHSLEWAINGNLEKANAHKELNNQFDQEYALTASFFDGLLTKDKRARKAYEELLAMLAMTTTEAVAHLKVKLIPQAAPAE